MSVTRNSLVVLAILSVSAATTLALPMSPITEGDLTFDNFSLEATSGALSGVTAGDIGATVASTATGVSVTFDFTTPQSVSSDNGYVDISYEVTNNNPTLYFSKATTTLLNGSATGAALLNLNSELTDTGSNDLGSMSLSDGLAGSTSSDVTYFPAGEDFIQLNYRIFLGSFSADTAEIDQFMYEFETVPEPASLSLLGLGGLALLRRRRKTN